MFDMSKTMRKYLQNGKHKIRYLFPVLMCSVKNMWSKVKEEKGRFRYHVWVKSTFFTTVIILIYASIKAIAVVISLVEQYKEQRFRIEKNIGKLNEFLIEAGWMGGLSGISRLVYCKSLIV